MIAVLMVAVAIGLAIAELLVGDFWLLMISGGVLSAAGTEAIFGPHAYLIDSAILVVVSLFLLWLVRPVLKRRFIVPLTKTNTHALEGKPASVISAVGPESGLIKISGQEWTARPFFSHEQFEPGEPVIVVKVDGATALVQRGI